MNKNESYNQMLELIKDLNYVFYVVGTNKAMREVMANSKDIIRAAEAAQ